MGGAAKTIGRVGSGVLTLGGSEIARNNLSKKNPLNQLLQAPGAILTGGASMPSLFGGSDTPNPYISGPFTLDPNQLNQDQSQILGLGSKQYADTLGAIDTNSAAQTKHVADIMKQTLPDIAENAQAAHLYDSTGYGNEVARQQTQLASQVASDAANQKMSALQGLQGFQTGALQRGQSLEDFINQANVSKSIGQAFAPQPPSGKANFGTVASGVGALAPMAKVVAK